MNTKEAVPLDGFLQMIQRSEQALPMSAGATKCCVTATGGNAHKSTPAAQKEEKQEKKQLYVESKKIPAAKSPPKKPVQNLLSAVS